MTAPSLLPRRSVIEECITQIYVMDSRRELRAASVSCGNHDEARRHDRCLWDAAESLRNIIRERPHGAEAYRIARREYRA